MRNFLKTPIVATALALGATGAMITLPAFAADEISVTTTAQAPTLAVQGYDVVSYQTPGEPVEGLARFSADHDGATYRFSDQANLDAFTADPARFVPAYGGFCAYGVSKGKKFDADPEAYTVVDGRLYLNVSKRVRKTWLKKRDAHIDQAETRWTDIEHVAIGDL
ncbi:YHS domain-containing (seleno)protein [uncultured Algimonas sp.]|uniref:YHS domain-containing (seleno)protein n=1 Tax=uncultured Algimonas sp. TaxID=1547920 RepID=UPI002637176B|nr:YHS domain-containing (seleno)protein [uncultured Algimonas sp.]